MKKEFLYLNKKGDEGKNLYKQISDLPYSEYEEDYEEIFEEAMESDLITESSKEYLEMKHAKRTK